ncbi:leukemia inhibitory factor receptor-like isoform X2 [Betta splendens]|uniref:Leukemia inhibitory factor receptor-like isoform X2 n=1 Tax=Betta splendens TaxID=158456 RepID=A0A9W2Y6E6_BETSP|nr:leukemia inhibitory factor receptor-like isoform X2 [Betta splendens]
MDTRNRCRILEGVSSTTARRTTMITWFLLVTLFCKSTQGGNADGNSVWLCEPWNLTVNSSKQTIVLTWEDDPSCSAGNGTVVYELEVLAADHPQHYDEVPVTPEQTGEVHVWSWRSPLALECASHSVRISSRYKNQRSPWKLERTLPALGNVLEAVVFPQNDVFRVGSTVTFCCVLPPGAHLKKMSVGGYKDTDTNTIMISKQTHALTVLLNRISKNSCTNVFCITELLQVSGTCVYVDDLPADKNLQCETRDLKSVICRWTVGTNADLGETRKSYWLQGRKCETGYKGSCSIDVAVNASVTTWTLVVQNRLGTVNLTDVAAMTQRVYMLAPDVDVSHVNARNVCLTWRWREHYYTSLNVSCQVNVSSGETSVISETSALSAVVINLIPNWSYTATVRCATEKHVWKWGDWSPRVSFHTKGDVPDPPDVWMQMKENHVIITWKELLANQSHGTILDYTVSWAKTGEAERRNSTTVTAGQSVGLSVDTSAAYSVSVTARNSNGSSSASSISVPPWSPDRTGLNPSRISGSDGGFSLRWSASPKAACGYVVDWCPTSGNCTVEWIKVPPHQTKATISSKNFRNGVRYTLSVYACTQRAPLLLEQSEGYVREEKIQDNLFEHLNVTQQDYNMEVSWDPVRLAEQPAFIRGYVLYWSDNNSKTSFSVTTANPEATSLTATNLRIDSYEFTLKALTAVGECGTTRRSTSLNSLTDALIKVITIYLVTASCLILLLTIICCRHWTCIKWKVYPPVPKPVLMDKWMTSPLPPVLSVNVVPPFPG